MAQFYTSSPLGLLSDPLNIGYDGDGSSYKSVFSSYSGEKRQIFKSSNSTGKFSPILSKTPHSNVIYDVSTSNIIEQLKGIEHLELNYADFAYLKNFGVYPNNRLLVARRYPHPVIDDLYSETSEPSRPLSTVLGYMPEDEDFIKLSFNEEWEGAEVSFTNLLNELGKDFGFNLGGGLGSVLEGAVNVVPLPGATLLLQRKIMKSLGIISDENDSTIPQGDPNLIKESMNRSLIGENEKGAGVKCQVSITLKTIYEQKFINGVDPSIVFMDILQNCLNMGTSPATFYLGKQVDAANKVGTFLNDFMKDPIEKIKQFILAMVKAFESQLNKLDESMKNAANNTEDSGSNEESRTSTTSAIESGLNTAIAAIPKEALGYIQDFIKAKYKIKFMGIINALTGGPSTPWHITVGNPLRPIFCSGDMLCSSVDVNFGPQLSFNDLPTYIEVTVNLKSARNLGLQEIFSKFNAGGIRTTDGLYTSGNTDGATVSGPISFWNTDNYTKKVNALENVQTSEEKPGQEAGQNDNGENTTNKTEEEVNQGGGTKVSEIATNDTNSPTPSLNSGNQSNSDVNSPDPVIPAGTDANTQSIRTDETQDQTGSTEGFTDQKQNPDDIPYTGQDARTIQENNSSSAVTTISEELDIFTGPPISFIVTGTYDIGGKQVTGRGVGNTETSAKSKAKQDALKKSK